MHMIKFNYCELQTAVDFLHYCVEHNVQCSALQNDGIIYFVNIGNDHLLRLNKYLLADVTSFRINYAEYLVRVNECLLRKFSELIAAENDTVLNIPLLAN